MPQNAASAKQVLKTTPLFAALDDSELTSLAARFLRSFFFFLGFLNPAADAYRPEGPQNAVSDW
jgi:hypothetical protein